MKTFILRARKAWTNPNIDLRELPKQGKLDSVCMTISNAIWFSGDVRRDTIIHVVLEGPTLGPKTISFFGNEIRGLRHDEMSIASYIKDALGKGAFLELNQERNVRTGIKVAKKSFERLVWECSRNKQIFVLDEKGNDIRKTEFKDDLLFIIGSVEGLPPKTEKLVNELKAEKISLGPKTLFAAHCPIVIHNELDRLS